MHAGRAPFDVGASAEHRMLRRDRRDNAIDRDRAQYRRRAARMIAIEMRDDQSVEAADSPMPQVRQDQPFACVGVSGIARAGVI